MRILGAMLAEKVQPMTEIPFDKRWFEASQIAWPPLLMKLQLLKLLFVIPESGTISPSFLCPFGCTVCARKLP